MMRTDTCLTVDIIGMPPEVSSEVIRLLGDSYGLVSENVDESRPRWAAYGPDLFFENRDGNVGQAAAIARQLRDIAESALHPFVFEVVEEAAEDWMGDVFIYVPWLGLWSGDASGGGSPYVSVAALERLLDGPWWDLRRKLEGLTGRAWRRVLTELRDAAAS
jgi:Protein of unknown function (DUF3145)